MRAQAIDPDDLLTGENRKLLAAAKAKLSPNNSSLTPQDGAYWARIISQLETTARKNNED